MSDDGIVPIASVSKEPPEGMEEDAGEHGVVDAAKVVRDGSGVTSAFGFAAGPSSDGKVGLNCSADSGQLEEW